jgi:hypothetical protein
VIYGRIRPDVDKDIAAARPAFERALGESVKPYISEENQGAIIVRSYAEVAKSPESYANSGYQRGRVRWARQGECGSDRAWKKGREPKAIL